jgi:transcriptional regulator with XRE-family HTH domain
MSPTDYDRALGQILREVRVAKGFSQMHLGNLVGVTFQQIQKYERAINRVSFGRFLEICEVLEVSPERIIYRVQQQTRDKGSADACTTSNSRATSALMDELRRFSPESKVKMTHFLRELREEDAKR